MKPFRAEALIITALRLTTSEYSSGARAGSTTKLMPVLEWPSETRLCFPVTLESLSAKSVTAWTERASMFPS